MCRQAPIISHMLFVDDTYFYYKADMNEASKVLEVLKSYEKALGQIANSDKSSIFFGSNIIPYNRDMVCQVLQMTEADERSKCLGLPNILGKKKSVILGFLKKKVHRRIRSRIPSIYRNPVRKPW